MFPENAQFSAPSGFRDAIRDAASKNFMKPSEYLRRCALQQLERDGVRLEPSPASAKRLRG
ncbi:hypothetical protein [Azorhizobium doebereinerae]|uniref:hypothetical protein n=1 Tax=Azorhizobium doebereinerae TaxID=281091 RepID=UPI0003F6FB40|nr:hypothetical protein [Azorhizobium doebereinerae]